MNLTSTFYSIKVFLELLFFAYTILQAETIRHRKQGMYEKVFEEE